MNYSVSHKLKRLQSKQRSMKYRKKLEESYEESVSLLNFSSSPSCNSSLSSSWSFIESDVESSILNESDFEQNERDDLFLFETNQDELLYVEEQFSECYIEEKSNECIYLGSNVTFHQFCVVFLSLMNRLKLSENGIDMLLKFIISILPADNILPKTYEKLLKCFEIERVKPSIICALCSSPIEKNKKCLNDECVKKMRKKQHLDPIIYEFKYIDHLKTVIEDNWSIIVDYRNLLAQNRISDICNAKYFHNKEITLNSISILLFFDGASFDKSLSGTVWAILGMVCNLPPILRSAFYNIVKFMYINGKKFNLNSIFEKYLLDFKNLLKNGIKIDSQNITINIFIHGLISDTPARSKICNTKQFNGEYGCLFCLHPGQSANRKRIYPYTRNVRLRDNKTYNLALENINSNEKFYCGIKGI